MYQVWNQLTGMMAIENYDEGVFVTLGANSGADASHPCFSLPVPQPDGTTQNVNVYFSQPESIFEKKVYPFVTINRDDFVPAMNRWHSWGQLEYKVGVSGTQYTNSITGLSGFASYQAKVQAFPFDITYTISGFDRYESGAQILLSYLLKHFPPIGRLIVFDSLGLKRTYDAYLEGPVANLQELIDTTQRVRGYAITVRVEGELDLADPYFTNSVSGVDLNIQRLKGSIY